MIPKKMMVLADCNEDICKIRFMKRLNFTQVVRLALKEYVENHIDLVEDYNRLVGGLKYEKQNG